MPTSSFTKDFIINSNKATDRLIKVLEEKGIGNEEYKKIDIKASLEKGRLLARKYFGKKR